MPVPRTSHAAARGAFTLIELLLVVSIIALLIGILLPAISGARRTARLGVCQSNLRQQGIAMNTYGADFKDQLFSYSWRAGMARSEYSDLNNATNDADAACNQMTDIIRRQGERDAASTPPITPGTLFPYLRYSHLVLQDYLGTRLPDPTVACPEDRNQAMWSRDPFGYDAGKYQPNFGTGGSNWRWPYRSNYWIPVAAFDNNAPGARIRPYDYSQMNMATGPNVRFGNRKLTEVAFPGQKVFMYEQFGRHTTGKFDYQTYFGFDSARVVVQFFDNSVSLRNMRDANRGNANPGIPNSAANTTAYNANGTTPDPAAPNGSTPSFVRFSYTRGGLQGVDFGGKEILTTRY